MTRKATYCVVVAVLLALVNSNCAFAGNRAINWYTFGTAGGAVSSASKKLNGTAGQTVVGYVTGASHQHSIGYWYKDGGPTPPVEVAKLNDAKTLADGTRVHATGKIATTDAADFSGFFYSEEPDRSSGIRVVAATISGALARGATIEVTGEMATTGVGERYIDAAAVTATGIPSPLGPLGMTNKSLGGGDLGTPPSYQMGAVGGAGTNNIGLLTRVWGLAAVSGVTTIDDGSGMLVTVDTTGLSNPPADGAYVSITGVSSLLAGGERLLLAID